LVALQIIKQETSTDAVQLNERKKERKKDPKKGG
jgi:hypothetical protein